MKYLIGPGAPRPMPRKKIVSAAIVFAVCAVIVIVLTTQTDIDLTNSMGRKDALLLVIFIGAMSCGLASPALLKNRSTFLEGWVRVALALFIVTLFIISWGGVIIAFS